MKVITLFSDALLSILTYIVHIFAYWYRGKWYLKDIEDIFENVCLNLLLVLNVALVLYCVIGGLLAAFGCN